MGFWKCGKIEGTSTKRIVDTGTLEQRLQALKPVRAFMKEAKSLSVPNKEANSWIKALGVNGYVAYRDNESTKIYYKD